MLDAKIRGLWDKLMRPVGESLGHTGMGPNAITVMGVGLQALVASQIVAGRLTLAGFIAVLAALSDTLDGAVAKARGVASDFGALLDSTTDRLSDALYFLPIAWLYGVSAEPPRDDQAWVAALALAALVTSFLVSYVKARAEGLGFECNVGIAERAERLILGIVGLFVEGLLPLILAVLTLLSAVTVLQRLAHVRSQIKSPAR